MSTSPAQPDLGSVRQGLRMAKPPDPAALAAERQQLVAAEHAPFLTRARTYLRLIGPGYMQSAMTLGAGTASAALFAGAAYGYELLWVAPLAMLLGIVMLAAVAHQTLSTGERPMHAMATHAGRFFAFAWAAGSLVASVVWHLPQYNLAANAMVDACDAVGIGGVPPMACSLVVLGIAIALSMLYGRSPGLVRAYERTLKWMVWAIVFSLLWVVLSTGTDWGAVLRGFVPGIPQQRGNTDAYELIASGLAAAVGVNMVFLFPYSLLARGWGREHRRLAAPQGRHHVRAVGLGHVLVAGLDKRQRGHVARGPVCIGGDDAHLLAGTDLLDDGVLRGQLNLGHAWRAGGELRTRANPLANDAVAEAARLEDLLALMRHGGRGLEQHERIIRRGDVRAAAGQLVRERAHVILGVVAAEGELEPVLAVLRAVAGALVAAGFGQHRVHVADEIGFERLADARDFHGDGNTLAGK